MSRAGMHTKKLFSAKLLYPFVSLLVSTLGVSADISMGPTIEVVVGPKKKLGIGSLTMAALRKIG